METMNAIFELIYAIVAAAAAGWRLSYFTHMQITHQNYLASPNAIHQHLLASHFPPRLPVPPECLHILNQ